jgi:type I restriction-modification system DNA methylase subunit
MPVEVLGNAYEQFLGKVIRITPARGVKIEEKPEVRKAGGVYYTPQYIVDYIVKNTVGKLIEGKTPKEIEKIKIVDPACGSGSFLVGAFEYLLNYHRDWYHNKGYAGKKGKDNLFTPQGALTSHEKKRILTNNIYGVDLDANAVEVSKLSLLLKCMEGETEASIKQQITMFNERVLPDLDANIKDGNSLIDIDFYEEKIDLGYEKKIKPFSWKKAFPAVFKQDGFDVVIGNPPWGAEIENPILDYLKLKHAHIVMRMIDTFMYFIHKSYSILKTNGKFGMIIPDVLFYQLDNTKLREFILKSSTIHSNINLGNVFEKVIRPACITIFTKSKPEIDHLIEILDLSPIKKVEAKAQLLLNEKKDDAIQQNALFAIPNFMFITSSPKSYIILDKIQKMASKRLSELIDEDGIQRGVSPDLKEAFLVTSKQAKENKLEKNYLRNVLTGGKQVKRYYINYPDLLLIYTRREDDYSAIPNICRYINQFKSKITCKEVIEKKHSIFSLHRAREEKIFLKPQKLIGVITEDEIKVSMDSSKCFATDGLYLFGVNGIDIKFLMALLNSRLFVFIYRLLSLEGGRVLAQVKPTVLNNLPIKTVDTNDPRHIKIVENVDAVIENQKLIEASTIPSKIESVKNKIDYCQEKINQLVYELYSLTEEEIAIVEGGANA